MTADHHELSPLGLVDEWESRLLSHDDTAHGHIGVSLTPAGQTLGQRLVLYLLQFGPAGTGQSEDRIEDTDVAPRVHGHQPHLPARGFIERDRGRQLRLR